MIFAMGGWSELDVDLEELSTPPDARTDSGEPRDRPRPAPVDLGPRPADDVWTAELTWP